MRKMPEQENIPVCHCEEHPSTSFNRVFFEVVVAIGFYISGTLVGYSAPAIPSLMDGVSSGIINQVVTINTENSSWIACFHGIGGFIGTSLSMSLVKLIGPKKSLGFVSVPLFIFGQLFIFTASHVYQIYFGRIIGGVASGIQLVAGTRYMIDMSFFDERLKSGLVIHAAGTLGILSTFCLGPFLNWSYISTVIFGFIVPFAIGVIILPESPVWLIKKGKEFSASKSIEWFYGRDYTERILNNVRTRNNFYPHLQTSTSPHHRKYMFLSATVIFLLQLSGFQHFIYFGVNIYEAFFNGHRQSYAAEAAIGIPLAIGASMVFVLIAGYRFRRKPLLLSSMSFMLMCLVILSALSHIGNQNINFGIVLPPGEASNSSFSLSEIMNTTTVEDIDFELYSVWMSIGWASVCVSWCYMFWANISQGFLMWVQLEEVLLKGRKDVPLILLILAFITGAVAVKSFTWLGSLVNLSGIFTMSSCFCMLAIALTYFFIPEFKQTIVEV